MNIFNIYASKIIDLIKKNKKILKINEFNNFKGITVENPPEKFDFDLSCNICLILAKINNLNPKELATNFKKIILKEIKDIENIEVAGPGFLNIKLSKKAIQYLITEIFKLSVLIKKIGINALIQTILFNLFFF